MSSWYLSSSSFSAWKQRPVYVVQCNTARIANMLGLFGAGLRCLPGQRNARSQDMRDALATALRYDRRSKHAQLKNYVVLFREAQSMTVLDLPLGFQCYAENLDHAQEQCLNAYPDCEIVWLWQGLNGIGMEPAIQDWQSNGVAA